MTRLSVSRKFVLQYRQFIDVVISYMYYQVQDSDESSADKSGKPFTSVPNSSNFFVVVGRNVNQWRASLGLEEGMNVTKFSNYLKC